MQKLYSMFPSGAPGFALLLLRLAVAATLLVTVWAGWVGGTVEWLRALALLPALLLGLGLLTPIAAGLAGAAGLMSLVMIGQFDALRLLLAANAAALALLGPGAYSVDARLFGRRVVVVPLLKEVEDT